jgi:hypothetical protein
MHPITRVLVERLRRGLLSRNRHFRVFHHPRAREALRVHHFLRSVERDLLRRAGDGDVRVDVREGPSPSWVLLRIEIPRLRARRMCTLTRSEFAILLTNPDVRALLHRHRT